MSFEKYERKQVKDKIQQLIDAGEQDKALELSRRAKAYALANPDWGSATKQAEPQPAIQPAQAPVEPQSVQVKADIEPLPINANANRPDTQSIDAGRNIPADLAVDTDKRNIFSTKGFNEVLEKGGRINEIRDSKHKLEFDTNQTSIMKKYGIQGQGRDVPESSQLVDIGGKPLMVKRLDQLPNYKDLPDTVGEKPSPQDAVIPVDINNKLKGIEKLNKKYEPYTYTLSKLSKNLSEIESQFMEINKKDPSKLTDQEADKLAQLAQKYMQGAEKFAELEKKYIDESQDLQILNQRPIKENESLEVFNRAIRNAPEQYQQTAKGIQGMLLENSQNEAKYRYGSKGYSTENAEKLEWIRQMHTASKVNPFGKNIPMFEEDVINDASKSYKDGKIDKATLNKIAETQIKLFEMDYLDKNPKDKAKFDQETSKPISNLVDKVKGQLNTLEQQKYKYHTGDNLGAWLTGAVTESGVQMAPALLGTLITRNPEVGASIMFASEYGSNYAEYINDPNLTYEQRQKISASKAIVSGVLERMPLGVVLKNIDGAIGKIAGTGATEGFTEMATEALHIGLEKGIIDKDTPFDEALKRVLQGGLVGGVMGSGMGAIGSGVDVVSDVAEKAVTNFSINQNIKNFDFDNFDLSVPENIEYINKTPINELIKTITDSENKATKTGKSETDFGSVDVDTSNQENKYNKRAPVIEDDSVQGLAVQDAKVSELKISEEIGQFKDGANKMGVVEPLGGKFERTGVAPIQVWERLDGTKEVISGRHRLDLAQRSGEETIPVQIHKESDGFTAQQARTLDAELNIRDGQGKVKDYVKYFTETGMSKKDAEAKGLLARGLGIKSFEISSNGSSDLLQLHKSDQITDNQAYTISQTAPKNNAVQKVGLDMALKGRPLGMIKNVMQAVLYTSEGKTKQEQDDMFGDDTTAVQEAEELAKKAYTEQRKIGDQIKILNTGKIDPVKAKSLGIDINIKNPESLKQLKADLQKQKQTWENWHTNPELITQLKSDGAVTDKGSKFDLDQETESQRQKREESEAKTKADKEKSDKAEAEKAKADKDADDFNLTGSDSQVDIAEANGQDNLFDKPLTSESRSDSKKKKPAKKDPNKVAPASKTPPLLQPEIEPVEGGKITLAGKVLKIPSIRNMVRHEDIRKTAEEIMGGIKMYTGGIKGRLVKGYHVTNSAAIRLRSYNAYEVLVHELAHHLDFNYFKKDHENLRLEGGETVFSKAYKDPKYNEEVQSLSYTTEKKVVNSEGFAEYVRAWVTQYDYAKEHAPKFTKEFERLLKTDKFLAAKMYKMRELAHIYHAQGMALQSSNQTTGDSTSANVKRGVVELYRDAKKGGRMSTNALIQMFVDHIHFAKMIETRGGAVPLAEGGESSYKALQLLNGANASYEIARSKGIPFYDDKGGITYKGPSLDSMWEKSVKLGKQAVIDQGTYFAMLRSQGLGGKNKRFSSEQMSKMIPYYENKYPHFKEVADINVKYVKAFVESLVASRVITKDTGDAWQRKNEFYVPLNVDLSNIRRKNNQSSAGAGSGNYKSIKGHSGNILPVYENMQKQLGTMLVQARTTKIVSKILEREMKLLKSKFGNYGYSGQFFTFADTTVKMNKVQSAAMAEKIQILIEEHAGGDIESLGLINDHGDPVTDREGLTEFFEENPAFLEFFTGGQPPKVQSGESYQYLDSNGKTKHIEISNSLGGDIFSEFINNLYGTDALFSENQIARKFISFAQAYKRIKTQFITKFPNFLIKNTVMDAQGAFARSGGKFIPGVDTASGLKSIISKDKYIEMAKTYGVYSGTRFSSVMESFDKKMGDLDKGELTKGLSPEGFAEYTKKMYDTLVTATDVPAELSEMATRVGYFKKLVEEGVHPSEAAYEARQISVDFGRHGTNKILKLVTSMTAFSNASIQGIYNDFETYAETNGNISLESFFKTDEGRKFAQATKLRMYSAVSLMVMSGMLIALYNNLQGDEEEKEKYQSRTPDEQARFSYLGSIGKIPKAQGYIGMAQLMGEKSVDEFFSTKENYSTMGRDMLFALKKSFVPPVVPDAANYFLDISTNTRWTGAPIVKDNLKDLSNDMQHDQTTSRLGVAIGEKSKGLISPIKFDHLMQTTFSYGWDIASEITDRMLWNEKLDGGNPESKEVLDFVVGSFMPDKDKRRNKYSVDYYDMREKYQQFSKDQTAVIASPYYLQREYYLDNKIKDDAAMYRLFSASDAAIRTINNAIVTEWLDNSISVETKKTNKNNMVGEINGIIKEMTLAVKDYEKSKVEK